MMDEQFDKWAAQYRKDMGWHLQYEDKYDLARAAFEAGYKLAMQLAAEAIKLAETKT